MRRGFVLARLVAALALVSAGLGLGFAGAAEADGPGVCGWAKVENGGTSSTVTVVISCGPHCLSGGPGVSIPPGSALGVSWQGFTCVYGL